MNSKREHCSELSLCIPSSLSIVFPNSGLRCLYLLQPSALKFIPHFSGPSHPHIPKPSSHTCVVLKQSRPLHSPPGQARDFSCVKCKTCEYQAVVGGDGTDKERGYESRLQLSYLKTFDSLLGINPCNVSGIRFQVRFQ